MKMAKKSKKTIQMVLFMPRGGNHGGGRPKIPLELKKVTVAFSLNPITLATLRAVANLRKISVSDLANQILEDHFTE